MKAIDSSRIKVYFADEATLKTLPEAARNNVCLVSNLDAPVDRAVHAVIYFSADKSNPNGDMDADGAHLKGVLSPS